MKLDHQSVLTTLETEPRVAYVVADARGRKARLTIKAGATIEELEKLDRALENADMEGALWRLGVSRIRLRYARRRNDTASATAAALAEGAELRQLDAVRTEDLLLPASTRKTFRADVARTSTKGALLSHLSSVLVSALRATKESRSGSIRRMLPALHRKMVRSRRREDADALVRRLRRFRDHAPSHAAQAQAERMLAECHGAAR